jgi:hypothetical protein
MHFALLKDFETRMSDFGKGEDDIKLFNGMIIHTADFNGGAKEFPLARIWSEKVN